MGAILEVEKLEAFYGRTQALHGVSFAMEEGGITTVLGANGAGKTTTLRAISAMVKTRGSIRFGGKPIEAKATEQIVAMGIAHVPEGRGTFVDLTVEENLRIGMYARRDKRHAARDMERVLELFPILGQRRRQHAESGVSVLLVEQNASLALDLADHVFLLETGRVVLSGTSDVLKKDDAIRRSYLGY